MNDQNSQLADSIIETIEGMLDRPEMYVGENADSLEGQFFTLFTLVAPFRFGMSSLEAGGFLRDFVEANTGTNQSLSSVIPDVKLLAKTLAKFLQGFYVKHGFLRTDDVNAN